MILLYSSREYGEIAVGIRPRRIVWPQSPLAASCVVAWREGEPCVDSKFFNATDWTLTSFSTTHQTRIGPESH